MSKEDQGVGVVEVVVMAKPEFDRGSRSVMSEADRRNLGLAGVRTGKLFHLTVEAPDDEARITEARAIAEALLCNPVIETYEVSPYDAK